MNEIQKKITQIYNEGQAGEPALWEHAWPDSIHAWPGCRKELESNTSAFCLMPEWMQEAMKMMPDGSLQMVTSSGKWHYLNYHKLDSPEATYRLNPAYVFEEDHPEHIADVVEAPIFLEDGGLMFQHPRATFKKGIGQAVSMEGFIAYVYERGASIKVPERTLFDKPRIYCYHRGITLTPTHVRFRAAK